MDEREFWLELLKICKGKYIRVNEMFRLTKEMGDLLARDDRVSVNMLLGMRQDEIDRIRRNEERICMLLDSYPALRRRAEKALKGECGPECGCAEERETAKTNNDIRSVVSRMVELDRVINQKIAGKDSFYAR